jgi:hypothetical protein
VNQEPALGAISGGNNDMSGTSRARSTPLLFFGRVMIIALPDVPGECRI